MQTPAATVCPASLTANLDIKGLSFCVSKHKFPAGLILTLATSPFSRNQDFPLLLVLFLDQSVL